LILTPVKFHCPKATGTISERFTSEFLNRIEIIYPHLSKKFVFSLISRILGREANVASRVFWLPQAAAVPSFPLFISSRNCRDIVDMSAAPPL